MKYKKERGQSRKLNKLLSYVEEITPYNNTVKRNSSGYHSHNVYTIEDYPPKYNTMPTGKISDAKRSSLELIACLKDINAGGYGNIPKLVNQVEILNFGDRAKLIPIGDKVPIY